VFVAEPPNADQDLRDQLANIRTGRLSSTVTPGSGTRGMMWARFTRAIHIMFSSCTRLGRVVSLGRAGSLDTGIESGCGFRRPIGCVFQCPTIMAKERANSDRYWHRFLTTNGCGLPRTTTSCMSSSKKPTISIKSTACHGQGR